MKSLTVDVCVCTSCVMNGAMEIIEAIESLKKLKVQLRLNTQVKIVTHSCLGDDKHSKKSPLISINDKMIEKATSETVMSQVLAFTSKGVK